MAFDLSKEVEELFFAALERDPKERYAFLEEACAGKPELKKKVDALLTGHEKSAGLASRPAWVVLKPEDDQTELEELEPEPDLPFKQLGEFRLVRQLGEGGMGIVYLAVQVSLNRRVAVKVIRPERMGDFEAVSRFKREVDAVSRLRHPNIAAVFGGGEDQGVRYFAMEWIPGKELGQVLKEARSREGKVPLTQVLGWFHEIACALDAAHQSGIIHRDVKPSNIQITSEDRAVLMDFGVAQHMKLSRLTITGAFRGTPHYASPEQVRAKPQKIDTRTDVYSLGVALYEAITGQVPFEGETTEQVFHLILRKDPIPPRRLNPTVSRDLENVVLKAMEKEPGQRYETMKDFSEDLRRLIAHEAVRAKPLGWMKKTSRWIKRHKVATMAFATTCIILATFITFYIVLSTQKREKWAIAKEWYKPVKEALNWTNINDARRAHEVWCYPIDPEDPAGYMLDSLGNLLFSESEEDSLEALELCLKKCTARNSYKLEDDAHYLLGSVKYALGQKYRASPEKERKLLAEAAAHFQELSDFNPTSKEAFLWREWDPDLDARNHSEPFDFEHLEINGIHYLVHLCLGLNRLEFLYKGGNKGQFEEAFECFRSVLATHPENVIAHTAMGRTYYFYARFYNQIQMVEKATYHLNQAQELFGSRACSMVFMTKGQNALLSADTEKAEKHFKHAIKHADVKNPHLHNAYTGLGIVYTRQGKTAEALEMFEKALECHPVDAHIKVALAELHLFLKDTDKALFYALEAKKRSHTSRKQIESYIQQKIFIASTYLTCARIYLRRGAISEALDHIEAIYQEAVFSPRDYGLACLLLSTLPDESYGSGIDNKRSRLMANSLKLRLATYWKNGVGAPPICLSAFGARSFLNGEYEEAVQFLKRAITERSLWPKSIKDWHRSEDARDLYLLAMIQYQLFQNAPENKDHLEKAFDYFEQGEQIYTEVKQVYPFIEYSDILERFRDKAIKTLAITE